MSSDSDRYRHFSKQHAGGTDRDRDGPEWQGPRVESYIGETAEETVLATKNDEPCEWISSEDTVDLKERR